MSPARAALEAARSGRPLPAAKSAPSEPAAPAASPHVAETRPAPIATSRPAADALPPWEEDVPPPDDMDYGADRGQTTAQKKTERVAQAPAAAAVAEAERPGGHGASNGSTHQAAPASPPLVAQPLALHPVPGLDWDGNWPTLAAALPVRGVVQQLAHQSELVGCGREGNSLVFKLRVPLETLCSSASLEKLTVCLSEHFAQPVRIESNIGAVQHTANAAALADRAARQSEAEQAMQDDPFVQTLMREFGATPVPGSIKPI